MNKLDTGAFLDSTEVSAEVFALRPDYRVELLAASGVASRGHESKVEEFLAGVEDARREQLAREPVTAIPHLMSWRESYSAFGAKPSAYRNSAEALIRRVPNGLPRINPLTDLYNALSVKFAVPIGGEDLATYAGPARLVRADGTEEFETTADGEPVLDYPAVGEVVWIDNRGVTCRRWNWRQSHRTALTETSGDVFFILDLLDPFPQHQADELIGVFHEWLARFGATSISHHSIARDNA
jgi:DNA/RNA-binding domain of Phe-tRNA-synthetase-like protein